MKKYTSLIITFLIAIIFPILYIVIFNEDPHKVANSFFVVGFFIFMFTWFYYIIPRRREIFSTKYKPENKESQLKKIKRHQNRVTTIRNFVITGSIFLIIAFISSIF